MTITNENQTDNWALEHIRSRKQYVRDSYASIASVREKWILRNRYFYNRLGAFLKFIIEPGSSAVLFRSELGQLFALSSIAVLMQFGTSALALVVLALRRQRGLRPREAWPALPTLAVAVVLVVSGATPREGLVAAGAVVLGLGLLRLARPRAA